MQKGKLRVAIGVLTHAVQPVVPRPPCPGKVGATMNEAHVLTIDLATGCPGGAVVRAGNLGRSREVGTELDLTASYQFDRHLFALLGYSHFFPGKCIKQSGASQDIDFLYLLLQYTF